MPLSNRLSSLRGLLLIIGLVAGLAACAGEPATPTASPPTPPPSPTPVVDRVATVKAAQRLPTLSPDQAQPYHEVELLVLACDEFHPNRRTSVLQHLAWLTEPNTVPAQFVNLYGNNMPGQLAFGAGYMVAVQWKVDGRLSDSCLIPIGTKLNAIIVVLGATPLPEFTVP